MAKPSRGATPLAESHRRCKKGMMLMFAMAVSPSPRAYSGKRDSAQRMGGILGDIEEIAPRSVYPLGFQHTAHGGLRRCRQVVPPAGIEPAAFCSGGRRSIP